MTSLPLSVAHGMYVTNPDLLSGLMAAAEPMPFSLLGLILVSSGSAAGGGVAGA